MLWSFDMLQANAGPAHTSNSLLLENDAHRQAYLDNYLTPLVKAVKDTPGLYGWDIFNEPEGMGPNGWATYRTTMAAIQRTVNWLAAAIRTADPDARSRAAPRRSTTARTSPGKTNYYSDSALRGRGRERERNHRFLSSPLLCWQTAHRTPRSCTRHRIGRSTRSSSSVSLPRLTTTAWEPSSLYAYLYDSGYVGAWAWAYNSDWPWPSMQAPMQNLYSTHPNEVGCPSTFETPPLRLPKSSLRTARESVSQPSAGAAAAEARVDSYSMHWPLAEHSSAARARAEQMVNHYPDSEWVREMERFTGAHRHRNLRVNEQGVLEAFLDPHPA